MSEPIQRYKFRLAERLGYTVGELGARMTMGEFRQWIAHDRLTQLEGSQHG